MRSAVVLAKVLVLVAASTAAFATALAACARDDDASCGTLLTPRDDDDDALAPVRGTRFTCTGVDFCAPDALTWTANAMPGCGGVVVELDDGGSVPTRLALRVDPATGRVVSARVQHPGALGGWIDAQVASADASARLAGRFHIDFAGGGFVEGSYDTAEDGVACTLPFAADTLRAEAPAATSFTACGELPAAATVAPLTEAHDCVVSALAAGDAYIVTWRPPVMLGLVAMGYAGWREDGLAQNYFFYLQDDPALAPFFTNARWLSCAPLADRGLRCDDDELARSLCLTCTGQESAELCAEPP